MRNPLFDVTDKQYRRPNDLHFEIGDTVVVTIRIVEGARERLQDFEGTVIARRGGGLDEMFTVRRIVANEGIERTFPIHSPRLASIRTVRSGKVRRGKLYFLRDRVGKARKLRERRISAGQRRIAAEARAAKARAMQEAQEAVEAAKAAEAQVKTDTEMAGTPS